jgi:hypothetical protein
VFPAHYPADFPSALAEGCIPTVLPARYPADFPSPSSSPRARAMATAAAQRLPPTVREGPTVSSLSASPHCPRAFPEAGFPPAFMPGPPHPRQRGSPGFPLASKFPSRSPPTGFPSRSREGYRSRTAAVTDSSRGLHPNCVSRALSRGFPLGLGRGLHPNCVARALSRGFPLAFMFPSRSRDGCIPTVPHSRPPQRVSHRARAMAASHRVRDSTPQSHRKMSPIHERQRSPRPAAGSVPRTKAAPAAESKRSPPGPT